MRTRKVGGVDAVEGSGEVRLEIVEEAWQGGGGRTSQRGGNFVGEAVHAPAERVVAFRHLQRGVAECGDADDGVVRMRAVADKIPELAAGDVRLRQRPRVTAVTPDVTERDVCEFIDCAGLDHLGR